MFARHWYILEPWTGGYPRPGSGRFCAVNNTFQPQRTTVFTDGGSFSLTLAAGEIRWFDM